MQCRDFEDRLQLLLDGRTPPESDSALRQHAQQCEACAQLLAAQSALFRGLRQSATPAVMRGFSRHVVGQLADAQPQVQRAGHPAARPWRLAVAVVSAAALALVAMTTALRYWPRPDSIAAPGEVQPAGPSQPEVAVRPSPEGSPVAVSPDRSPSTPPRDPSLEQFQEYGQAIGSITSQIPDAVERLDEVEQAAPAVRPVRTSFSLAIGTIRRTTLPGSQKLPAPKSGNRDDRL